MQTFPETPRTLHDRLGRAALIVGLWLVLGAFLGVQSHVNSTLAGRPIPIGTTVGVAVERYLVYAVLTFPILRLCRRFPFRARRRLTALGAQVLG